MRAVGDVTNALHALKVGDEVGLRGPFGNGFVPEGADHLLVAGGYGAAPMLFLSTALRGRVRAVVGARTKSELILVRALDEGGVDVHTTTEDGSQGRQGLVTDVVAPWLALDPPDTLYACGPHGMLSALDALAAASGVRAQLSWEAYMRCGVGLCGSCEHQGRLLCVDGPVLAGGTPRTDAAQRDPGDPAPTPVQSDPETPRAEASSTPGTSEGSPSPAT